ncbi:MAG: glycerol kinase, partial [Methylobacter sp.]
SGVEVVRPTNLETTALGAAYLAGISTGLWTIDELNQKWRIDRSFYQTMLPLEVESLKRHWLKAVERTKNWIE